MSGCDCQACRYFGLGACGCTTCAGCLKVSETAHPVVIHDETEDRRHLCATCAAEREATIARDADTVLSVALADDFAAIAPKRSPRLLTKAQKARVRELMVDEGQSRASAVAWVRAFEPDGSAEASS